MLSTQIRILNFWNRSRTSLIEHSGSDLFAGLPSPLRVGRYHSLIVDEATISPELTITARTDGGVPMALQHRTRRLFGVQFHPESVLTEQGRPLLANFLRLAGLSAQECSVMDWREPNSGTDEQKIPVMTW